MKGFSKIIKSNKNKIEELVLSLILLLSPYSIIFERKLYNHVLLPLLIIYMFIGIKRKGYKKSNYDKLLLLFIGVITFSLIFTNYPILSWREKYEPYRFILIPIIFRHIKIEKKYEKILLLSLLGTSVQMFKLGFLDIIKHFKILAKIDIGYLDIFRKENINILLSFGNRFRLREIFPTLTETALILGAHVFSYTLILLNKKVNKGIKFLMIPFIIIGLGQLILTQSRGMYLSFGIVLILTLLKKYGKQILILIVLFLGITFKIYQKTPYIKRFESIASGDKGRMKIYTAGFKIFKDNPITGIGFDNFEYATDYFKAASYFRHPHNMGLKMLLEMGVIGFISYYLFMLNIVKQLWINREDFLCEILLGVVLMMLIYENFETVLFWRRGSEYIFFFLGIALSRSDYQEEKK